MSSAFPLPFPCILALQGKRIRSSVSVGRFAAPGCSAAMDLSSCPPLIKVGATATGTVFLFLTMVVHCYTRRVLAPDAATAAMLGRSSGAECIGAGVRAGRVSEVPGEAVVYLLLSYIVWVSLCS